MASRKLACLTWRSRCASACAACEIVSASTRSLSACALATAAARMASARLIAVSRSASAAATSASRLILATSGLPILVMYSFLSRTSLIVNEMTSRPILFISSAQMAFQDQADESLALLWRFGKKLFGGSLNRFGIGFNFDLCDGFHRDRDALSSIEILLGRDVERHQLQREHLPILHHRKNHGAASLNDTGAAETIDHKCLMRPGLAVQPGEHGDQEHDGQCHQSRDD